MTLTSIDEHLAVELSRFRSVAYRIQTPKLLHSKQTGSCPPRHRRGKIIVIPIEIDLIEQMKDSEKKSNLLLKTCPSVCFKRSLGKRDSSELRYSELNFNFTLMRHFQPNFVQRISVLIGF